MRKIIEKIRVWWQSFKYFVIVDPEDNSVTLSKKLFDHIKDNADGEEAKVFVFRVKDSTSYGFVLNPTLEEPTILCDIQYNEKYKCIGFETLLPTVVRILYDYGIHKFAKVKLSVSTQRTVDKQLFYKIERPNEKHIRRINKEA